MNKNTDGRGLLRKTLWAFSFMFCFAQLSLAQSTVTGIVKDAGGVEIIGANILATGTDSGTVSDIDGTFSLDVPSGAESLTVSYLGYQTQTISIDGRSYIEIMMNDNAELLDEIVVVGYGVQKKSDLVGSVASIDGSELTAITVGNPTAALQGKLSGIQVENNGGAPGGASNVFVRGVGSLTNSFPQYVVDGTFVNDMRFLNPKDIESIEVLKDASSAAIYGSRAANGVVLITTKKGDNDGGTRVSLDLRTGTEAPSKLLDLMNGEQFATYRRQIEENDNTGFTVPSNLPSTDWQDLSLNPGSIHDYGVSISGGGENSRIYSSINFFNQDGVLVGSDYDRINARINAEFKLGKLTVNPSLGLATTNTQENNWFGFDGSTAPILPGPDAGPFEAPRAEFHGFGGINKYGLASLEENNLNQKNVLGNINFTYAFTENLSFKLNFGADYVNDFSRTWVPTFNMSSTDAVFNVNLQNDLTEVRGETLFTMWEPTLSYNRPMNNNGNLNVVLGFGEYRTDFENTAIYGQGTPNDNIQVLNAVSTLSQAGGVSITSGLRSLFGRVNYNHADKYLFQATVRRDGSSRFREENRFGIFPSFSVGWKIHNEDFFSSSAITRLKLRAGYGTLGSQNIPDFAYQSTLGLTSGVSFGGQLVPGFAQTQFVVENLKWEEATTTNVGIDVGLNNDKFIFSAEYYVKNITDVLAATNLPGAAGTSLPVIDNVADIKNSGFEFEGLYRGGNSSNFKWDLGINFATLNSEITKIPNPIIGPSIDEDIRRVNRFIEGESPGVYYGYIIDGVFASQQEIDNYSGFANMEEANEPILQQPGDFIRRDINGDGLINGDDQTIIGDPTPDFIYGINFGGQVGAFDFSLFFNGVQGNEIYNVNKYFHTVWGADDNKLAEVTNAWTPTNTDTNIPRATASDPGNNRDPSSYFVEDGSYFRLRTLELGYTFKEGTVLSALRDLRVFVTGQNLLTLTGYSGYDPDIASTNGGRANRDTGFQGFRTAVNPILGRGLDARAYPNTRSFVFGVQANF